MSTEPPSGFDFEGGWQAISPDDIAGIVYTSGTTGEPKGVEWSHRALMDNMRGLYRLAPPSPAGRWVSYLPMAHLAERFMSHYCSMAFGYTITTASDIKQLAPALVDARPTRFFAVPRVYEKLGEAARAIAAGDATVGEALQTSLDAVAAAQTGQSTQNWRTGAADARRLLAPIRERLGLDASEYRGAAAAPMREDTHHLFTALGLPVAEIWGMSETGLTVSNPPERIKMGTVGRPQPGVEAKLADDGELMIRGPIFTRYRNDPERTDQAFDGDGWLYTGDVATVDEDGYYRIVDRKKELIINAAGKNIAPAMVENRVKRFSPLIGFVVAIGDQRSYLTALIVLDEEALGPFAGGSRPVGLARRSGAGRRRAGRSAGCDRRGKRYARPRRAGEEVRDPRSVLGARERGGDADDEAEAPCDQGALRGGDRIALPLSRLRLVTPWRTRQERPGAESKPPGPRAYRRPEVGSSARRRTDRKDVLRGLVDPPIRDRAAANIDEFIDRELKPLEEANPDLFDHRREFTRTDVERGGIPTVRWRELLATARGCRSMLASTSTRFRPRSAAATAPTWQWR